MEPKMEDVQPPNGSRTKPRRSRPNTYTPQACERCRSRKQRCLMDDENPESCRNCIDSGSTCVYAPRPENKAKRSRGESSPSTRSDENETVPFSLPIPTAPLSFRSLAMSTPSTSAMPRAQDWQPWSDLRTPAAPILNHTPHLDFFAPPMPQQQTAPPPPPPPVPQLDSGGMHDDTSPSTRTNPQAISPASEETIFETAKGLAMVSLEAAAEPHYVGESSGSLWTTIIARGMHAPATARTKGRSGRVSRSPSPHDMASLRSSLLRPLPDQTAQLVIETVYRHLHPRYPFMDWVSFEKQWAVRNEILLSVGQGRKLDKNDSTAAFFILMILAIGSQYSKQHALAGLLRGKDYYALAAPYLSGIVQLHNLANVQGLLLLAVFSLRDSSGPSIWYISGVGLRLCIGLGLHRSTTKGTKYNIEMRKRVFWTCYVLDRMSSMILGRPPGLSDDDIDIELPDPLDPEIDTANNSMSGSMSSSIHYIKIKQIESQIQRAVYTLNKKRGTTADYYAILQSIDQWEQQIPAEAALEECWSIPCCSRDWFLLRGVEARLHLLRPLCSDPELTQTFLLQLAQNGASGCELQKRIHQSGQPSSSSSVHSTFICGLAVLYSVFLRPTVLPTRTVFSAIKAASNTLFAYSQIDSQAMALFEVFDELSTVCMDKVTAQPATDGQTWQEATLVATGNSSNSGEYADFLRNLGMELEPFPDSLWDLAAFSPGVMVSNDGT